MAKYIPLDDVLAGIKRLHKEHTSKEYRDEAALVLEELEESLDSLKVKEVDLVKEAERFVQTKEFIENKESPVILIARHFLERGLALQKGE